jgi:hypothetical protein
MRYPSACPLAIPPQDSNAHSHRSLCARSHFWLICQTPRKGAGTGRAGGLSGAEWRLSLRHMLACPRRAHHRDRTMCSRSWSSDAWISTGFTRSLRLMMVGDERNVRLSVENKGPPIAADTSHVLFEPLQRGASRSRQTEQTSLGLGLFIVRQIASAHAGSVTVSSAEGRTVFTVTLPK